MAPLKIVLDDEKQLSERTGDSRAFNVIREMRSIRLQSTCLGLETMVRYYPARRDFEKRHCVVYQISS